jgi:maltose alpha-D-glucosyltransferase/alpha-amylase
MNGLLFSFPGTPIIYSGDEIGMGDNIDLGDGNGVRTPMQWNGSWNAGFSEADHQAVYSPILVDPPYGYQTVNVMAEERTSTSLLRWTRRLIQVRNQHQAFGRGTIEFLPGQNRRTLIFVRQYQDETILVVCNLSRYAQPVEVDLRRWSGMVPIELWACAAFPPIRDTPYFFTLGPHTFLWFRLVPPADVPTVTTSGA